MSKTFSDALKARYKEACKMNKGQTEIYHCATSTEITKRSLDLDSEYVFLEACPSEKKNNEIKEYKLQAYLAKEALKDSNWLLPIINKEWVLLDAERLFAQEDLCSDGEGKRLDFLAYESASQSYIVLELKVERNFAKAKQELKRYTGTIQKLISGANDCYQVDAKNVRGYIVWPINENPRKIDNPWGLVEYNGEFLKDLKNIKFEVVKEPD